MTQRLFLKVNHENLPQVKDKFPFIYLERGRLEVDDSSVMWINSDGDVVRIPCAMICTILLGPGTSITHEAVKTLASANCVIQWVGEDDMLYYAVGQSPTATSQNFRKQMLLAADPEKAIDIARKMFTRRFPSLSLKDKSLRDMMGMEGQRVKQLYRDKSDQYSVTWTGRFCAINKCDSTNQYITFANAYLYSLVLSVVYSLGYSPYIGFIHSGSPLPFIYDIADLYKEYMSIDLAFYLSAQTEGIYNKKLCQDEFRKRALEINLLSNIVEDIQGLFKE